MSITEKLNKIKSCKEDIKQAIIDKGVDMTGVSLEGYATKISEIQSGGGSGDYLDIRANLSTYYSTVESVGSYVFAWWTALQSVNLPNCSYVGDMAFYYCSSLQSANLPMCLSVWNGAFSNCTTLQTINLPMCVNVSASAFYRCYSLQSIDLPICSYVGQNVFTSCSSLQSIDLPMCSYVGHNTFSKCTSLQSVNLPMCAFVGNSTFASCSSLSVLDLRSTYSCSLSNSRAFSGTPFASGVGSIYVHAAHLSQFQNATNWTYFSKCFVGVGDPTRPLLSFDNGRVYGDTDYLYKSNWQSYLGITSSSVISIDLPNFSYVGICEFEYCSSLQSVNLPNCSYVGSSAFHSCTSLQSIDLPMCEYVDDYAFTDCSLQSVNLPMCSHLGERAINDRDGLTLYIGSYISTVCKLEGGFDYIMPGSSKSIFVPMSLVDAYKSAPVWSRYSRYIFGI